jgi:HlyD family secretion protein
MRRLLATLGMAAAAAAALMFIFGFQPWQKPAERTLTTARPTRAALVESTVATGTVRSKVGAEVKVGAQISGVVSRLYVNVGDVVTKGQLLATLDDAALHARVQTLASDLEAALSEQRFADSERQRMEQLKGIVAGNAVESAKRNAEVRAAAVGQVRARLRDARIQLGHARITAPIAGNIASVSTNEGETVAASLAAPTFVTIVDLKRLEVHAYVDETDIGKVKTGMPVSVRLDAFPGTALNGVARAIYPKPQLVNNVVNYVVIVDLQGNEGLTIRPEMTARVSFILDRRDNALSLPRAALLRESGKDFVVVQGADGWTRRQVRIGLREPQRLEVLSGLREDELVLADAQAWKERETAK